MTAISATAPRSRTNAPTISIRDLRHCYGKQNQEAVAGINLDIYQGEIFGLIGPDGAGKTTTFQILSGVMPHKGGIVEVLGSRPKDVRLQMGYLTQRFSLYPDLSIMENLRYAAGLREVSDAAFKTRSEYFLGLLDLARFKERLAGRLSGGMKQKLALCCVLIHQPKILLLDEPTTGVDPVSRREFWDILAQLAATEAMTTVVATPYLDEAERCSRIALMYEGKIQQCDTPAKVKASLGVQRLEVYLPVMQLDQAEEILKHNADLRESVSDVQRFGARLDVLTAQPQQTTDTIRRILEEQQLQIQNLTTDTPTLENTFVARLRELKGDSSEVNYPRRYRRAKKNWVLQMSDLVGREDMLTADLPGGWKQRVAFGAAVMHEPKVLFLDEPTSGVDPLARRQFWRWINSFAREGMAVLVTTHYLEEAEQCHRLGFMVAGELVAQGTPRQVKDEQPGQLVEWECEPLQKASDLLKEKFDPWRVSIFGSRLHTILDNPDAEIPQVQAWLNKSGFAVHNSREIKFSLEDVFISVVDRARQRGLDVPVD